MNLDALIAQTYGQYQTEQAAKQAEKQSAEQAAKQEAVSSFLALLEAEIGTEMFDTLGITMSVDTMNGKWFATGQWMDEQSGTAWRISSSKGLLTHTGRAAEGWTVNADGPLHDRWFNHTASSGNTRDAILIGLGTVREKADRIRAKNAKELAERERRRQEAEVETQKALEQRAERERISAAIEGSIEEQRIEALSSAWLWPAGKQVTIYVLQYCTGAAFGDEDGVNFDYRTVYTMTDELDDRGYITVFDPARRFTPETIRLSIVHHKPVFERLVITGLDEVPSAILTGNIEFVVRGVKRDEYSGGLWYYAEGERMHRIAAARALPAQWLRDLVDRA